MTSAFTSTLEPRSTRVSSARPIYRSCADLPLFPPSRFPIVRPSKPPAEHNYHLATIHLLSCPTSDAARTLADVLFDWSKLDPEAEKGVGRYAARGVLRCAPLQSVSVQ